jgi:tripartite-type tricarboxylate transporter receptor subunit TctC
MTARTVWRAVAAWCCSGAILLVASCAAYAQAGPAAQAYPIKPVRVIVGFAPGGSVDIVARQITPKLTAYFGQPFVVDNRSGGGGSIGVDLASKAAPDGHTITVVGAGYAANAALYKTANDPVTGIAPIIEIGFSPHILAVHPSVPARSVKELIAYGKANPGQLAYTSSGTGSLTHLATELFANMGGLNLIHVPYRGAALGLVDVVGGRVQMIIGSMPPTLPLVRSGKLNGLAVTTVQRWHTTPELPTISETLPGYDVELWFGVWAPRGTPGAIVARLNAAINKVMREDDLKLQLTTLGVLATGGEPRVFADRLRRDVGRWKRVVEHAGIKPDS